VNLCSCACQSANIQQQESRAVADFDAPLLVLTQPSWISVYKTYRPYCQNVCMFAGDNVGIFIKKFVVNSENTSIFVTAT